MLIESIKLKNILSFGPETVELELRPLTVLIGPNGSGKSNFIDVLDLIRSLPKDVGRPIRQSGGIINWIWRGQHATDSLEVNATLINPTASGPSHMVYSITIGAYDYGVEVSRESLHAKIGDGELRPYFSSSLKTGEVSVARHPGGRILEMDPIPGFDSDQSILAYIKDPRSFPAMTGLGETLSRLQIYREWPFGRIVPLRGPQQADLRNDVLNADGTNLGLVLSRLRRVPKNKRKILDALRRLYDGITDYDVITEGGTVQIFVEEGDVSIPAVRLSDGTLRYLCLLAILCDPNPPPLVCIEEPELGLHPDMMPGLTDLLLEASERCQLLVTTHSELIVDALTETPEYVVVCEKVDGQTKLQRLDTEELAHWLKKYRLGDLWTSGQIGGNRW